MERGLRTPEIRVSLKRQEEHNAMVPSSVRQRLPHYGGGRTGLEQEPDVETRRAYMARRPGSSAILPKPSDVRGKPGQDERGSGGGSGGSGGGSGSGSGSGGAGRSDHLTQRTAPESGADRREG
jgi:hypothetical protein